MQNHKNITWSQCLSYLKHFTELWPKRLHVKTSIAMYLISVTIRLIQLLQVIGKLVLNCKSIFELEYIVLFIELGSLTSDLRLA